MGWSEMWDQAYWREPWQSLGAITNSIPVGAALLGLALWRKSNWLWVFACAWLIHCALDFPLHADDAHRHFWPLTDWRFFSPISYWDPDHNGRIGVMIEGAALIAAAIFLWRRFESRWVRIAAVGYVLVYLSIAASAFLAVSRSLAMMHRGVGIGLAGAGAGAGAGAA